MPISTAQSSPFNSFIGITKQLVAASILNGIDVDSKTVVNQTRLQQLNAALPIDIPNCIAYTQFDKTTLEKIKTQIQQVEVHNTTVDCRLNLAYDSGPISQITLSKEKKESHILFTVDPRNNPHGGLKKIQKEVLHTIKALQGCENISNTTQLKKENSVLSEASYTRFITTSSGEVVFDNDAKRCAISMLQSAKSAQLTQQGAIAFPAFSALIGLFAVYVVQAMSATAGCFDAAGTDDQNQALNVRIQDLRQETPGYSKAEALAVVSTIALKNILQASTAAAIGGAVANGICTVEDMRGTVDTTGYSEKNMYLASLLGSSLLSIPPALHLAHQLTLQTQDNNKRCQYKNNDAAHNTNMLTFPITQAAGVFLGQTIMTANTIDSAAAKKTAVAAALGFLIFSVGSEVALNLILRNRDLPEPRQNATMPPPTTSESQRSTSTISEASITVHNTQLDQSIIPIVESDNENALSDDHASGSKEKPEIEMQPMPALN